MASADQAKDDWASRFLGIPIGPPMDAPPTGEKKLLPQWSAARAGAGADMDKLRDAMQASKRPRLQEFAKTGLHEVANRVARALEGELGAFDGAPAEQRPALASKVRSAIGEFRAFIEADRVIALLEANPLGVGVDIRRRLGSSLQSIEAMLPE